MKKVTVLGAGLVGGPMAIDLSGEYKVLSVDANQLSFDKLQGHTIETRVADLSDTEQLKNCVADADFVVNAVPGFMGFETTKRLIQLGKTIVDISFFPENPAPLENLAKKYGATAIIDCGVAPGMSHMLAGHLSVYFDKLDKLRIYVGGLPVEKRGYWQYKAVFSPADVLEEYTRPARLVKNGKPVSMEALTESEMLNLVDAGELEAFNTDGLRSLIGHIDCPDMAEKTLRYQGYLDKIKVLKECGFLSDKEVNLDNKQVKPIDLTSALLFPAWQMKPGDHDLTVMRVYGKGNKDGKTEEITYDLLDHYDQKAGVHSMARTTGYTATAALRLLDSGECPLSGLIYPEFLGMQDGCLDFILKNLERKNIFYRKTKSA